jgi:hypothetical protein
MRLDEAKPFYDGPVVELVVFPSRIRIWITPKA